MVFAGPIEQHIGQNVWGPPPPNTSDINAFNVRFGGKGKGNYDCTNYQWGTSKTVVTE